MVILYDFVGSHSISFSGWITLLASRGENPWIFAKELARKDRDKSTHFQTALNKVPPEAVFFYNSPLNKCHSFPWAMDQKQL